MSLSEKKSRKIISPDEVLEEQAKKVLRFLNTAKTPEEIAAAVEIPGERDVGLGVARNILEARAILGEFSSVREVAEVKAIGPERFSEIVSSLGKPVIPVEGEDRLAELQEEGESIGKLAADVDAFIRVAQAFRAQDAVSFQAELVKIGLFERCRLICRWLCIKRCVYICLKVCGPPPDKEPTILEMREFAVVTARIATDKPLLKAFLDALDREDTEAFSKLIAERKLEPFCHQLCHWLCFVRCRLICERLCPPPPLITKVSYIPTSRINALGYASGPSNPPGTTPVDDEPNGVGDHPFGGLANIRGAFNIAGPVQYKVEFDTDPNFGSPTAIVQPVEDEAFNPLWPAAGEPLFLDYTRVPTPDGWYTIADMGLAGPDYLTDWPTPAVANDLYYLKLTVRNAAMAEFSSPTVPARIDNVIPYPTPPPSSPVIELQLQMPDGSRRDLGCCEEVERGDGNLIVIKLQAWDENFSSISVRLLGGCGVSLPIVATDGTPLSKTYNGNIADTGYPALTEFLWDPWAAKVEPCCYLIYVQLWDRAIVNNFWSGAHTRANWRSITIT